MNKRIDLKQLFRTLQGDALYLYLALATRTARMHVDGIDNFRLAQASDRPVLWAFWHQQTMMMFQYVNRFLDASQFVGVKVGDDRGDTLGQLVARIGAKETYKVNMKGNPVAAGRAVLRVIRSMKAGKNSAIAPDGPDGPAFVPKKGTIYLARKARAAVLPFGAWTHHAYRLNRWDHYLVPYPFGKMYYTFGRPILVENDMDEEGLTARLSAALHAARDRARALAGELLPERLSLPGD